MFIPWQKGSKVTQKANPGYSNVDLHIYTSNICLDTYVSSSFPRCFCFVCCYLHRFEGNGVNGVPWHRISFGWSWLAIRTEQLWNCRLFGLFFAGWKQPVLGWWLFHVLGQRSITKCRTPQKKGSKQKKCFKEGNLEGNPDLSILWVLFQTTGPGLQMER